MAQRLAARGDEVRVLTTFPHYPEWHFTDGGTERTKRTVERGVKVMRMRHKLPKHGSSVSRFLSELSFGFRALLRPLEQPGRRRPGFSGDVRQRPPHAARTPTSQTPACWFGSRTSTAQTSARRPRGNPFGMAERMVVNVGSAVCSGRLTASRSSTSG